MLHEKYKYRRGSGSGAVYGLGFIGAVIYYISHAATFWRGVYGFFKALVWPAIVVYGLMQHFKM